MLNFFFLIDIKVTYAFSLFICSEQILILLFFLQNKNKFRAMELRPHSLTNSTGFSIWWPKFHTSKCSIRNFGYFHCIVIYNQRSQFSCSHVALVRKISNSMTYSFVDVATFLDLEAICTSKNTWIN